MIKNIYIYLYSRSYQAIMKLTHKFNWHYTKELNINGEVTYWCQWCGLRGKK